MNRFRSLRPGRGRLVALVVGLVVGTLLLSPAGAHVSRSVDHLWSDHIRPRVRNAHYTKAESRAIFAESSDLRAYNKIETSNITLSGTDRAILAQTVPEGRWVMVASAEIDNDGEFPGGEEGTVTCQLRDATNNRVLSVRSTDVELQSASNLGTATVVLQAAGRFTRPVQMRMECRESAGDPDSHADNAVMTITRVNSLSNLEQG